MESPAANYTITGYNSAGGFAATINIKVLANALLSGLKPSAGALSPVFSGSTTSYTVTVVNGVASITLTPTASDPASTIKIDGVAVASGSASSPVALPVGVTNITATVTCQDGTATKTYTVAVTRSPSTNDNLSSLKLSNGTLSPVFSPATVSYTASVANVTSSLTLTPATAVNTSTVKVNGTVVSSGTASGLIALAVGTNTIITTVTAQDGVTTKTYTITVTRAASADANLSAFKISRGTLSPVFNTNTITYSAQRGKWGNCYDGYAHRSRPNSNH